MKIKTTFNNENEDVRGKATPPDEKRTRRKPADNQRTRLSIRSHIRAAFRLLCKVLIPAMLAVLVIMPGIFALRTGVFNLRRVSIKGCLRQNAVDLENIIREEFPASVLRIDLDKARRRLERETWVKRVEIHRALPSSLALRVVEREPVVLLELGGMQMMADSEGVLLGAYRREFGKINSPIFKGFIGVDSESYAAHQKENAERIRHALAMLTEIAAEMPQDVQKISELNVSELNNIKILMKNDPVEIFMGNGNYLKRFNSFMGDTTNRYKELKNQGIQVAQIDLSNDGQIVYKTREALDRERSLKHGRSVNR